MLARAVVIGFSLLPVTAMAKESPLKVRVKPVVEHAPKCERMRRKSFVQSEGWLVRTVALRCRDLTTGTISQVPVRWISHQTGR